MRLVNKKRLNRPLKSRSREAYSNSRDIRRFSIDESWRHDMYGLKRFEREVPEISKEILPPLASLHTNGYPLAPDVLFAMALKYFRYGECLWEDFDKQNTLLSLVRDAAKQGNKPARAIVYRLHEYFEKECAQQR